MRMEKNYVKGILAAVQNGGADLTDFKPVVLDINDEEVLANALGCVVRNEFFITINGIECYIFADDSGMHDEEAIATMIVKIDGKVARVVIKNLFICKVLNGHVTGLSDDECAIILGNLKISGFGYFPKLYLLINL